MTFDVNIKHQWHQNKTSSTASFVHAVVPFGLGVIGESTEEGVGASETGPAQSSRTVSIMHKTKSCEVMI